MANIGIVHLNTEIKEIDIGDNDKVSWIVLDKNDGSRQKFFPEKSKEELKAIWKAEHEKRNRLRKISYANAEKIIDRCQVDELKWLLNDIWDGNARQWLDNPDNIGTIGQEVVLETGFTTNQMEWIEHMFHILQGDE